MSEITSENTTDEITTDTEKSGENLDRLQNFPISFFAVIMGLTGFSVAWEKAGHLLQTRLFIDSLFAYAALIIFFVVAGFYTAKIIKHGDAVKAEIKHPVKLSFFPAISISMLLLSVVMMHRFEGLSHLFWLVGAGLHLVLFLFVINSWMHHDHYQVQHISPAWFIPAVGNVLVPIAGMRLGYTEVSWFFFSIGIVFWIILFTIFFYRILFHNPMPKHLVPTFFILIAPPAVGFVAYCKLNDGLDNFSNVLYYIGLFLTILLFSQFKKFANLPFFLSWWAYSFPVAAITIASFLMYELSQKTMFAYIGSVLLFALTVLIGLLIFKTLKAIKMKKVCVESH